MIIRLRNLLLPILIPLFVLSCNLTPEKRDPNVLLIVIDTLRADHLGCYGYEKTTSPHIDKFAETGVQFQNVYCQMPTTGPSHASIFTSRYPRNHGVLKNGWILSDTFQTIAEILKQNGYITSAIISSFVLSSQFGYSQGFDNYDEEFPKGSSTYRGKFWEGRKLEGEFDQRADIATRKAINWMRQNNKSKFFLWVHYFDPHSPYDPPQSYVKDLLKKDMTPLNKIVAKYDGEIRFVDDEVGKLLHEVESLGLASNTLIIITSDHGEGLGQHGWMEHGMFLYDEQTRIPLIMKFPNLIPGNGTIDTVIESIDIVPSVLDMLGLEKENGFSGKSFLPTIQGNEPSSPQTAFLERRHYKEGKYRNIKVRGHKFAVRDKYLKYICAPEEGTYELYNLAEDSKELSNLAKESPDIADKLEQMVKRWEKEQVTAESTFEQSIDQKSLDKLQSLGYVE